jgi:sugar lactone lactonase YvrE
VARRGPFTGDHQLGDVDLYRCGMPCSLPVSRAVGSVVAGLGLGAGESLPRLLGPAAALALPLPAVAPAVRVLRTGQGALESVIVDDRGRLFFSSQTRCGHKGAILRMDAPDAAPEVLVGGIVSPGGLTWDGDGRLIVGYGDSPHGGLIGNWVGLAGLLRVDPDTGASEPWVRGLGMSNGVARAPDGAVYASNDVGTRLDRVGPDGTVHRGWARVASANGLAVDPTGRFLYAAQTSVAARIARVDLRDPSRVTTHARAPLLARAAMLDGLAIDDAGRLFVAANGAGQVWRVDPDRCDPSARTRPALPQRRRARARPAPLSRRQHLCGHLRRRRRRAARRRPPPTKHALVTQRAT